MGVQSKRQVRTALVFVARPLLFAAFITFCARALFPSGNKTSTAPITAAVPEAAATIPDTAEAMAPAADRAIDLDHITTALVVASTNRSVEAGETAWLADVPAPWQGNVFHYVTDAPLSPDLAVPVNKGNEAMVYLTYIVDHYDSLADVVLFHHGHRRGWHQAMDSLDEVRRLRPQYLARRGYASLRCLPGCENIIVLADYAVERSEFRRYGRDVQLTTLLDDFLDKSPEGLDERVPVRLASPCCAQFAASRTAIRRRSRAWWLSLRQWVMDTPLSDMESGRLMEHTWHMWLGHESYHCPEYKACQCHVFGMGECDSYFELEKAM
ncbi:hypothetical protein SCUCBS95973_009232 [Sporothrix curviconia]|uniref:Uncharacterized protein n=1 Tax=Sporothrix curviconia TaxID=1260050 RepID=A0ABP0CWJ0_9PEZI